MPGDRKHCIEDIFCKRSIYIQSEFIFTVENSSIQIKSKLHIIDRYINEFFDSKDTHMPVEINLIFDGKAWVHFEHHIIWFGVVCLENHDISSSETRSSLKKSIYKRNNKVFSKENLQNGRFHKAHSQTGRYL